MADARTAILKTLDPEHEGGFQKNHNDRANWTSGQVGVGALVGTNGGITALDMPGVDIEHLAIDQKVNYYLTSYWKPLYSQLSDQMIADKIFDMGVLFGVATTIKILQNIFSRHGIVADGVFGPKTLEIVNLASGTNGSLSVGLLRAFQSGLLDHARSVAAANPNEAPFLADWIRRINS